MEAPSSLKGGGRWQGFPAKTEGDENAHYTQHLIQKPDKSEKL